MAIVDEQNLVDLSIDQAQRSNIGFPIHPLWVPAAGFDDGVFASFLKGQALLLIQNDSGGGGVYDAQAFDDLFWVGWEDHAKLVGEAARRTVEGYRNAVR